MSERANNSTRPAESTQLRSMQLAWLAAAVFVVSAGYGALMPVLPGWLGSLMSGISATVIARHVGFFGGAYSVGVLVGALLWGVVSDRVGRGRILIIGLVGYVASLLLLLIPTQMGTWGLYALRAATGFFVAAVVPVVSALVAEHTPEEKRARRFAWLSSMSLLGFLFGPGLSEVANGVGAWIGAGTVTAATSARAVIVMSAVLGAVMMLGLARTLPASHPPTPLAPKSPENSAEGHMSTLCLLSGMVTLVLAGFELGIVLQGQQHPGMSSRQVATMFAVCSLVMLIVNAVLFLTGLLQKVSSRLLIGAGLVVAMAGLAVMAWHTAEAFLYIGISLTSAGTGLVLPVIAYLAAGVSSQKLGASMGALAAAGAFGQTIGSSLEGWLFGAVGQSSFTWLIVPLAVMLGLLIARPAAWPINPSTPQKSPTRTGMKDLRDPIRTCSRSRDQQTKTTSERTAGRF